HHERAHGVRPVPALAHRLARPVAERRTAARAAGRSRAVHGESMVLHHGPPHVAQSVRRRLAARDVPARQVDRDGAGSRADQYQVQSGLSGQSDLQPDPRRQGIRSGGAGPARAGQHATRHHHCQGQRRRGQHLRLAAQRGAGRQRAAGDSHGAEQLPRRERVAHPPRRHQILRDRRSRRYRREDLRTDRQRGDHDDGAQRPADSPDPSAAQCRSGGRSRLALLVLSVDRPGLQLLRERLRQVLRPGLGPARLQSHAQPERELSDLQRLHARGEHRPQPGERRERSGQSPRPAARSPAKHRHGPRLAPRRRRDDANSGAQRAGRRGRPPCRAAALRARREHAARGADLAVEPHHGAPAAHPGAAQLPQRAGADRVRDRTGSAVIAAGRQAAASTAQIGGWGASPHPRFARPGPAVPGRRTYNYQRFRPANGPTTPADSRRQIHVRRYLGATLLIAAAACAKKQAAPTVQTALVSYRDVIVDAQANGVIEPIVIVDVKSKASGVITQMPVETGTLVKPGDLIVQVDTRDVQNRYNQAKAALDAAQAKLSVAESDKKRNEEMFKARVITPQEFEQVAVSYENAKSGVVNATAALDLARQALEDATVKAASEGTVITKNVAVGTVIASATGTVSGGTTLIQMADLSTVRIRAQFNETDIGNVHPGEQATVTIDAYPDRPFQGVVAKIEPQAVIQQNVTMFPVLVNLENSEKLLKPGMNGEVSVLIDEHDNVLAIPNDAIKNPREAAATGAMLGMNQDTLMAELKAQGFNAGRGGRGGAGRRGGGRPGGNGPNGGSGAAGAPGAATT